MKTISGKRFCKILGNKGWKLKKTHGSHHIYMKSGRRERISVPVHGNKDLKQGLQKALMKIAEINESELQNKTSELLSVCIEGWKKEMADIKENHYPKFGDKLPKELVDFLDKLEAKLNAAG